jgi:hypothetical protein
MSRRFDYIVGSTENKKASLFGQLYRSRQGLELFMGQGVKFIYSRNQTPTT